MRHGSCALALVVAGTIGCGGSDGGMLSAQSTGGGTTPVSSPTGSTTPAGGTATGTYVITIQNMGFSPLNLAVPPGATLTVVNNDGIQHSVTSEPSTGSYTPGAPHGLKPFDTGVFSSGRRTITVPANATAGTVIPYYCTVHRQTMNTPNGTITIDPSARAVTSTSSTPTPTGSSTTPTAPTSMPPIAPSMPANGRGY